MWTYRVVWVLLAVNDPPASFSKPGSEVRTEDKTALGPSSTSAEWLSLATPRRSVPVLGHFCLGASLSPEECQGGDLETFPQLRMNGCPPNTLSHSLSLPTSLLHTEEKQKTATGLSLSVHHRLYNRSGRSHCDDTHWLVDCCFEASSLACWW